MVCTSFRQTIIDNSVFSKNIPTFQTGLKISKDTFLRRIPTKHKELSGVETLVDVLAVVGPVGGGGGRPVG